MEESKLIDRLKQGDPSALASIIDRYAGYASTIVRNIIGAYMKSEDIEEAVSDVFVRIWHHAAQIQDNCVTLKSYLAAIARNEALKKLRGYRPQLVPLEDDVLFVDDANAPLERSEKKQVLEWALSLMGEQDREIFVRHYFFMEKTSAIARQLGMNESTVRSRLSRGRGYLRQALLEGGYRFEDENLRNV